MVELEESGEMTGAWEVTCSVMSSPYWYTGTLYPETDKERRMKHKNGKMKSVVTADILYEMR